MKGYPMQESENCTKSPKAPIQVCLLISRYSLEIQNYHDTLTNTDKNDPDWEADDTEGCCYSMNDF